MPPKKHKKKLEEEEDKIFEKSQKKMEAASKWLQVLEENEQPQEEQVDAAAKKTPSFDFANEQQYLKAEAERLKRKQWLEKMIEEAEEQIVPPEELQNQQTDQEKAERLRKEEALKQKKRLKQERQRELRRMQRLEEQKELQLRKVEELKQEKAESAVKGKVNWIPLVFLGILIGVFYLTYHVQLYQRMEKFQVTGVDLYTILEADSGLTDTELKAKYKKLVLKYHPDKNRQCHDCREKFNKIVEAWEILGNAEKREQYDASNGVVNKIKSTSTTLTPQNYHHLVEESGELWIIQVYDETSDYCHRYAPIWQEAADMFKGFVRFGRIDAWHQQDMLSYIPYSFTVHPSIYSMRNGYSDLYAFDLRNPLGSLKQFIDSQITASVAEITDTQYAMEPAFKQGKIVLVIPTERKFLPYQIRSIGQRYESTLQILKVHPKGNKEFLDRISLGNTLRLYFSAQQYEDMAFPHSPQDFASIDKRISKAVVREMTICRMTDACSDVACLLILNKANISNRHYPKIVVNDPTFYEELERMKRETNQLENFDLGIYMDGKIALGYAEDVEDLTLDEGELIDLKCWPPIVIRWWKVVLGAILLYGCTLLVSREMKWIAAALGLFLLSELIKFTELLRR